MEAPIFELHVKPTYAVVIPQRSRLAGGRSAAQLKNEENLIDNTRKPQMSAKATRRLSNAVNWLVASAKDKRVFDRASGKQFNFKVNFVTLTLPAIDHGVSDHEFKAVLLHNFINTCKYAFGLKNFVWKVEAQENGNIHAHFTTDCFIHWRDLRRVWNRILEKKGIIAAYREKHSKMSRLDYIYEYANGSLSNIDRLAAAYEKGKAENWSNPNTTDVHAVHRVSDIAAYLAKYMSKKEEDRREIKGRLWGCSQNLSESNKLVLELCSSSDYELLRDLQGPEIAYKKIQSKSSLTGQMFTVGEIFFYKISDWGKLLKGSLLQEFNKHRFTIRHGIDFEALKSVVSPAVDLPPPLRIEVPVKRNYFSNL